MQHKLVTILSFDQPINAYIIKSKLESEGIECFIADEYIVTMNPLYSNAVGGVKVQVRELDVERAKEILQEESIDIDSVADIISEE